MKKPYLLLSLRIIFVLVFIISLYSVNLSLAHTSGFIYDGKEFTTVDVPGATSTILTGINDAGLVVGYYNLGISNYRSFFFDGVNFSYFEVPGAISTYAHGINSAGKIVGQYSKKGNIYGFIYDGVNFTSFSAPGANDTLPFGINDAGVIVGDYRMSSVLGQPLQSRRAFIFDGIHYIDLDVPGTGSCYPCDDSYAFGINDAGVIVGDHRTQSCGFKGYIYDGVNYNFIRSIATGINDTGKIVGESGDEGWIFDGVDYIFFRVPGVLDIGFGVSGINDAGIIVGSYDHYLTPLPSTFLFFITGLLGFAALRKKTQA